MVVKADSAKTRPKGTYMNPRDLASAGPIIPVLVIERLQDAVPLADALLAGGITVLEVTLRSKVALAAMEAIAASVSGAIVGAGTVRSASDARAAKNAGCKFAVSPGYLPEIAQECAALDLPLLPGVSTASEVMAANFGGYDFLKLFPATAVGGVGLLKALAGPFPDVAFCPTGGISLETAPQFLALSNVLVCGGSWLAPSDAVRAGDWSRITRLAQEASQLRGVRI
jgi:2-dehydro-3-deoxyphosphogluconate aldolase / (4S)-4-hydroxy-2-oxoglutarate aldolase